MKRYHHIKKATLAAMVVLALSSTGVFAAEMPVSGEVTAGKVTVDGQDYVPAGVNDTKVYINPQTGQTFTVVGNSVIDWSSFDIGREKALTFAGEGSNYLLNKVTGSSASGIYGTLNTQDLHFILANPSGITVGNGASLNVIDGGSILLAAMTAGANGNNISVNNYNNGNSIVNFESGASINGSVTAMGKTINVADGITFSGNAALKLVAGTKYYKTDVVPGNDVQTIGGDGTITFSGSSTINADNVTLSANAENVTMTTGGKRVLSGAGSKVNIGTPNLQNVDITAPAIMVINGGNITVSGSRLESTVDDVKVLSGSLINDGTTLKPTFGDYGYYQPASKVSLTNSTIMAKKDAIVAGSNVTISGKLNSNPTIKANGNVLVAAGETVPLGDGDLKRADKYNTYIEVTGVEIQGKNITIAGNNDVSITGESLLKATDNLNVASSGNDIAMLNGMPKNLDRSYTEDVTVNNSILQGQNINLLGGSITVNNSGTVVGTNDTKNVQVLARSDVKINEGTVTGKEILLEGRKVDTGIGSAITAVVDAGEVRLLAGNNIEGAKVTATVDNTVTVKGNVSGGDIMLAGGAVTVDGGTVNAGEKSAYLLAGNSIDTTKAQGSENAEDVISTADGNAVIIKNGANVTGNKVYIAGYSADLSSATNNSTISATTDINAVTGSVINNDVGTLVRQPNASRGRFSRDEASTVTVNGSTSSALIDMPTDGKVAFGSVKYKGIDYTSESDYHFNLASGDNIATNNHSIIDWNTFDIGLSGVLNFDTTNGALLNRVTGSYESWLKGTLNHTGTYPLLLVNPNGIHVYQGASINASNLLLSGLAMTNDAFNTFASSGTAMFDTSSEGKVKVDTGVTFANRVTDKLSLVGKNVDVSQNTISANTLSVNATDTATLTNLTYNGSLKGNDVFDSNGGSLTISGGTYNGAVDLKGSTVNMSVASHTGDVTAQGTDITLSGGSHSDGDVNLQGTSVTMTGVTFDDAAKDITLAGLGDNGSVNVTNSTITAADVAFSGKNVFVSQSGNNPAAWLANTFTLRKGESASNSSNINNVNLTITKEDETPEIGTDVALTLNNAEISAPKIAINPDSLTLTGGKLTATNGAVDIHATGNAMVQRQSAIKSEAGDISVQADGNATVKGNSSINASGNINMQAADINVGVSDDTANNIESTNGSISLRTVAEDAIASAASTSVINVQNANLITADDKSIGLVGYNVTSSGTISGATVNFTATNTVSNSGEIMATTLNSNSKDFVTSGDIHVDAMNVNVDGVDGNITVDGEVNVATDLTLTGGSQGTVALNGSVNAPSVKVASKTITGNGGEVVTDRNILLASGNKDDGKYTTTEDGKVDLTSMTLKADKLTVLSGDTSIKNSNINANTLEVAAADTVKESDWSATFGSAADDNTLSLTGNTGRDKEGTGAIGEVKLAGKNVTFGGGAADETSFKAASMAVDSGNAITLSSGQVDITGETGLSLSGKSITVDGTIKAKKIALTATDADVNLGAASGLTASDATNSITITADDDIKAYGNISVKDNQGGKTGSVALTAKNVSIGTSSGSGTVEAANLSVDASESIKVEKATINVNSNLDLTSKDVVINGGDITTAGTLTIQGTVGSNNKSVDIVNSSKLKGTDVTITGNGVAVVSSTVEATTGDINVASTGDNMVNFLSATIKAENAENGDIVVNSDKAIQAVYGNMTAGKDINFNAGGASSYSNGFAITDTGNLTAGNDISLIATAGEVSSSGNLTANSGNITLDSADGSKISTTGNLIAESGTIALGHAGEENTTGTVEIGSSSVSRTVNAAKLHVNATEKIGVQRTTVEVTDSEGINLNSNVVEVSASTLNATTGGISVAATDADIASSTLTARDSISVSGNSDTDITGSTVTSTGGNININNASETGTIDITEASALKAASGNIAIGNADSGAVALNMNPSVDNALEAKGIDVNGQSISASGKAFNATNGNITLTAKSAASETDTKAINVSNNMTASGSISLTTAAGEVSSSGTLTATNGNITLDSMDGSKIVATESMSAGKGSIALGHASGDAAARTKIVEIGPASGARKTVKATALNVNATDAINIKNVNAETTGDEGLAISSHKVYIGSSQLKADKGDLTLNFEVGDDLYDAKLIAADTNTGKGNISITSKGNIYTNSVDFDANKNITLDASQGGYIYSLTGNTESKYGDIVLKAKNSPYGLSISDATYPNEAITIVSGIKADNGKITLQSEAGDIGLYKTNFNYKVIGKDVAIKALNGGVDVRASVEATGGNIDIFANKENGTAISTYREKGHLIAEDGKISLLAEKGDIDLELYTNQRANEIAVTAKDGNVTSESNISASTVNLNAGIEDNKGNTVTLKPSSMIVSNGNVNIVASEGTINAAGFIESNVTGRKVNEVNLTANSVAIGADDDMQASTRWVSAEQLTVTAPEAISVQKATIDVTSDLALSSQSVAVTNAVVKTAGDMSLTATEGNVALNTATLSAESTTANKGNITITANAGNVAVSDGSITSSGDIAVKSTTGTITTTGGSMTAGHEISFNKGNANTGDITVTGTLTAESSNGEKDGIITLGNEATSNLNVGTVDNGATLTAGSISFNGKDKINVVNAGVEVAGTGGISLSSKEVYVEDSELTADQGNLSINSTDASKSLILTGAALTAKGTGENQGVIDIDSAKDVSIADGSMTANRDIDIDAAAAIGVNGGSMTAANDIALNAATGGVTSSGDMTATGGDIVLDSADGADITASGTLSAVNGNITLGHSGSNATAKVTMGADSGSRNVTAKNLAINATNNIGIKNATVNVTGADGVTLSSTGVNVENTTLNVTGKADLLGDTVSMNSTDLTAGGDVNINGSWTVTGTPVSITDTNIISSSGDVSMQAGKVAVSTAEGTAAKTIQGKNLLLAAANSYDSEQHAYGMDASNTVSVTNTDLLGEKVTLIGYKVDVIGDEDTGITTNNIIGAVSTQQVKLDEAGNIRSFVKPVEEVATNPKLTIDGMVKAYTPNNPININLYGDAVFHNTGNSALEAMSFRADSPYSLDIQGELTVTDTQGISLASKSIRIADNLTATNSSIKLSSTGGEMYIAGNLSAKDDIMVKSTQNIVLGATSKPVNVTSSNGKVSFLAGTFADDNGALGAWTGGTGTGSTAVNNNIGITNATISAKGDVDIKGGSIAVAGTSSVASTTGDVTLAAANSIGDGVYNVLGSNDVSIDGTLSLGKTHIYGDDVNFAAGSSTTIETSAEADVNAVNARVTNATIAGSKSINATNNVSMEGAKLTGTTDIKGSAVSITNSSNLDGTNTIEGSTITVTGSTLNGISNLQGEGSTISVTNSSLEGTVALNGQSVSLQGENELSGSVSMTGENATVTGSLVKKSGATAASLNVTAGAINVGNETAEVASTIDQLTATAADGTANVRLSDAEAVAAKTDVTVEGKDVTIGNSNFKSLDAKGTNSMTLGSEALTATGAIALQDKNLTLAGKRLTANTISLTADETAAISNATLSSSENSIAGKNVTMAGTNTISGATMIDATENVAVSGTSNVTGNLKVTAADITVTNGNVQAAKTSLKATNTVTSGEESTLASTDDDFVIEGKQVEISGSTLTAKSGKKILLTAANADGTPLSEDNTVSLENAILNNDVDISAYQGTLVGAVTAGGKAISADNNMLVKDASLADGVVLSAENIAVENSTLGNNNKLEASEDISVTGENVNIGATDVAVTLKAGRNLSISATPAGEDEEAHAVTVINSTLKSGLTDENGKTSLTGDVVNIVGGNSLVGKVEAEAGKVNLSGANTVDGSLEIMATDTANVKGTLSKATSAEVILHGSNVIVGGAEADSATINVDGLTISSTAELDTKAVLQNVTLQNNTNIDAKQVDIKGTVDSTGKDMALKAASVNIGDGATATSLTAKSVTSADGTGTVAVNKADIAAESINLQANAVNFAGTNNLTGPVKVRAEEAAISGTNIINGNLEVNADQANLSDTVSVSGNMDVVAEDIAVTGGNVQAAKTSMKATDAVTVGEESTLVSTDDDLIIKGKQVEISDSSLSAKNDRKILLTAANADETLRSEKNTVSLENATLNNNVDISAYQGALVGAVTAEGKAISADNNMLVKDASLADGVVLSAENIAVENSTLGNNNKLEASEDISVTGENVNIGVTDVAVTLEAGRNLSISATPAEEDEEAHAVTVINSTLKSGLTDTTGKTSLAGDVVNIAGGNSLAGVVEAESLTVNISGINTLQGKLVSEGSIEVSGAELVSDGSFAIEGNEINLSGTNTVKGTVDITVADTATILGTVNKAEGTAANLSLHGDKVIVGNNEEGSEVTDIKVDKLAISNVNSATLQNAKVTADTFTVSDAQNAKLQNAEITAVTSITDTAKATLSDLTMQADISVNAGETAVAGSINAAEHNVELTGNKVTLKDAEVTARTASVTAGEDAVLDGVSLATSDDNVTVTAPKAVLKGTVDAETITIDAANVQIGDGTVDTAVTANAVNGADGAVQTLVIDKADVKNANLTTKAAENIILTGAIDAEGKDLVLDAPNVQIGNGVADTAIKANSLSGVADNESTEALEGIRNLTLNKANVEEIGTLSTEATENILLKGRIEAGNKDLELKSPAVQIGDGTPGTSIEANTLTVQADEVGMNNGTVKASSAVLQGKKVILENNSSIEADKEEGTISLLAADTDNTVTVSVPRLDEEGNTVLDEDGNPVTDITSVRTITFLPDNAVVVDASRLEGADISLQGYTVAVQNGSAIYADKSLTALAGKEMKSVDGGMPEVTAKAEGEDEAPNTVIQQNSVIVVSGRNWRNFQPVPISYGGSVEPEEPVEPEVPVGPEVLPDNPVPVTETLSVEPVSSPGLTIDVAGGYLWGKDYSLFISWYAGQSDASRYRSLGSYFDEKFGISGYLLQGRDAFSLPLQGREGFGLSLQSEDAFKMTLTGTFFNMKQVNAEEEEKDEQ